MAQRAAASNNNVSRRQFMQTAVVITPASAGLGHLSSPLFVQPSACRFLSFYIVIRARIYLLVDWNGMWTRGQWMLASVFFSLCLLLLLSCKCCLLWASRNLFDSVSVNKHFPSKSLIQGDGCGVCV